MTRSKVGIIVTVQQNTTELCVYKVNQNYFTFKRTLVKEAFYMYNDDSGTVYFIYIQTVWTFCDLTFEVIRLFVYFVSKAPCIRF